MRITLEIDNINFKDRIEQFRRGKFNVDLKFIFNNLSRENIIIRNGVCSDEKRLDDIIQQRLRHGIVEIDIIDSISKRSYKNKIELLLKKKDAEHFAVSLIPIDDSFANLSPNAYIISLCEKGTIVFMKYKTIYIYFETEKGFGKALSIVKSIYNV